MPTTPVTQVSLAVLMGTLFRAIDTAKQKGHNTADYVEAKMKAIEDYIRGLIGITDVDELIIAWKELEEIAYAVKEDNDREQGERVNRLAITVKEQMFHLASCEFFTVFGMSFRRRFGRLTKDYEFFQRGAEPMPLIDLDEINDGGGDNKGKKNKAKGGLLSRISSKIPWKYVAIVFAALLLIFIWEWNSVRGERNQAQADGITKDEMIKISDDNLADCSDDLMVANDSIALLNESQKQQGWQ